MRSERRSLCSGGVSDNGRGATLGMEGGDLYLRVMYAHFPSRCVVDAYTVADARTPPTYSQL